MTASSLGIVDLHPQQRDGLAAGLAGLAVALAERAVVVLGLEDLVRPALEVVGRPLVHGLEPGDRDPDLFERLGVRREIFDRGRAIDGSTIFNSAAAIRPEAVVPTSGLPPGVCEKPPVSGLKQHFTYLTAAIVSGTVPPVCLRIRRADEVVPRLDAPRPWRRTRRRGFARRRRGRRSRQVGGRLRAGRRREHDQPGGQAVRSRFMTSPPRSTRRHPSDSLPGARASATVSRRRCPEHRVAVSVKDLMNRCLPIPMRAPIDRPGGGKRDPNRPRPC